MIHSTFTYTRYTLHSNMQQTKILEHMLFLHRSINIFVFVVSCCMSVIYLRCGEADLHCDTHHDQLPLIKTRATPQHHSPSLSDVWSRVRDRPSVSFLPRSTCTTVVVVLIVRRHRNATTPTTPLSPCRPQTHKKKSIRPLELQRGMVDTPPQHGQQGGEGENVSTEIRERLEAKTHRSSVHSSVPQRSMMRYDEQSIYPDRLRLSNGAGSAGRSREGHEKLT